MPIEPITIILITLLCSSFVKLIVGYLYSRFPFLSIKVTKNNRNTRIITICRRIKRIWTNNWIIYSEVYFDFLIYL